MRLVTAAGLVVVALAAGACGSEDPPETPAACLGAPAEYLAALDEAPGDVRLADETSISDCLVTEQEPGALATVGRSVVQAATRLNARARHDPGGEAAVRLGYLSGAVDEAAESTGGIHQDLRLRLASAARFAPGAETLPASFERGFAEGYAAARAAG